MAEPPLRLLNFVSENELEEGRESKGQRVEDGGGSLDRPLFEVLKENKDKKDAEFNERFKHQPPKALDEEETEFLESLEMYKKKLEKQVAEEEAQQLTDFHAAIASRTIAAEETRLIGEPRPVSTASNPQEAASGRGKRSLHSLRVTNFVKIKAQPKKTKFDTEKDSPTCHTSSGGSCSWRPSLGTRVLQ